MILVNDRRDLEFFKGEILTMHISHVRLYLRRGTSRETAQFEPALAKAHSSEMRKVKFTQGGNVSVQCQPDQIATGNVNEAMK